MAVGFPPPASYNDFHDPIVFADADDGNISQQMHLRVQNPSKVRDAKACVGLTMTVAQPVWPLSGRLLTCILKDTIGMIEVLETDEYQRWFEGLRDLSARSRILARLRRVSIGDLGDFRSVGDNVLELRIDCGPGYRVYFFRSAESIVVLTGGDKSTQQRDIEWAKALARALRGGGDE